MKIVSNLSRHSPDTVKAERKPGFPLRSRSCRRATCSLPSLVMWLVAPLIVGCATTLDGVFPEGTRRAQTPKEWTEVTITRGATQIAPENYLRLEKGDLIQTKARTFALIRFANGTEAFLAPDTRARIGSLFDFLGEVLAKVRGAFEVRTQYVTAAAKGTVFLVRSKDTGGAEVIALDGVVGISSNAGRWRSIDLPAGEKATVVGDEAPTQSTASKQELEGITRKYGPVEEKAPISQGTAVGIGIIITAIVAIIYGGTKDSKQGSKNSDRTAGQVNGAPPVGGAAVPAR